MQRLNKLSLFLTALAGVALLNSCDKTKLYETTVPPPQAHFTNTISGTSQYVSYYVTNSPTSTFNVVVGTTDVADVDRTVTFKITSPSGAVAGTHYSMVTTGSTVTIPAGQTLANITIHGIFAPYAAGTRKDTVVFVLDQPSMEVADFADTVRVVFQRYCDVDLAALSGPYNNTNDYYNGAFDWGPYSTTISDPTPGTNGNGIKKDTIRIDNFYDYGYPLNVVLDWNDPANFMATIAPNGQRIGTHTTYGAIFANNRSGGSFSSCDQIFTINFTPYVGAGTFTGTFHTVLRR